MQRSRSESEFEDLGYEEMPDPDKYRVTVEYEDDERERPEQAPRPDRPERTGSGVRTKAARSSSGWSNFIWGNYGERDSALDTRKDL